MDQNNATPSVETSGTSEKIFAERMRRLQDVSQLKQPDRIPIVFPAGYFIAEMGGITKQELLENPEKAQALKEKLALEFQPDAVAGPFPSDPRPHMALGDRMALFPGHGVSPNSEFQFAEAEFMKAEDYDKFLENPSDWAIRTYLPRAYGQLEGFAMLPPLGMFLAGSYNVLSLGAYTLPPIMAAFQAFAKAIEASAAVVQRTMKNNQRMAALGFIPALMQSPIAPLAPYDFMANTLRGMKGIMMDMYKQPEKLLAAEEKVSRIQLEAAINFSRATGVKTCSIFLHRGSDGFMSIPQFEKFYWPQLKNMVLTLVDNGITPFLFYEGSWDTRLKYLTELPKGKTIGGFQNSDIFKVKEVVGDTMCILGGMPNSLLVSGTVEEIREHTRKLCRIVGKGGGYIMCTTVGEMSGCKPELVKAWVDATREYGVYESAG